MVSLCVAMVPAFSTPAAAVVRFSKPRFVWNFLCTVIGPTDAHDLVF